MNFKVSIILPVYNVEKYLEECLNSAIGQTLEQIEIIAVDDGSTDNSSLILDKYAKKYNNIKVITQKNKGLSGARNTGLKHASGEYIYFLDSDDYIDINAMKNCYEIAKTNNLDIITFDAKTFIDGEYTGKPLNGNYSRYKLLDSEIRSGEDFYNYAIKKRGYRPPVWLNFYKLEFIRRNNLKFYEGLLHEDELFSFESFIKANKVMYIPQKYFFRRVRQDSIMTKKSTSRNVYSFITIAEEAYEFYKTNKCEFKEVTNENMLKQIQDFYSKAIGYCDLLDDIKEKENIREEIKLSIDKEKDIYCKRLNQQIYRPKYYYRKNNFISLIKNKLKQFL